MKILKHQVNTYQNEYNNRQHDTKENNQYDKKLRIEKERHEWFSFFV